MLVAKQVQTKFLTVILKSPFLNPIHFSLNFLTIFQILFFVQHVSFSFGSLSYFFFHSFSLCFSFLFNLFFLILPKQRSLAKEAADNLQIEDVGIQKVQNFNHMERVIKDNGKCDRYLKTHWNIERYHSPPHKMV